MRARALLVATIPAALLAAGLSSAQVPRPRAAPGPAPSASAAPAASAPASALPASEAAAPSETPPPLPPPPTALAASAPPGEPDPSSTPPAGAAQPPGIAWIPPQPGPAPELQTVDEPSGPTRDMSRDFWQLEIGVRSSWIRTAGFDPFSENDNLTQLSISGTRALLSFGPMSLAAGLSYEVGGKEAEARGAPTSFTAHRFGAVGEGRLHLGRDVYSFVKIVPQAVYTRASLQDASVAWEMKQQAWRFGFDGTVGGAWNIPRTLGAPTSTPEAWLIGELGYGWTGSKDVKLVPDVTDSDPSSKILLNTGPLALNGWMMRVAAAVTF